MFKGKFNDIVLKDEGFLRGPFGSALKKSLFVPKSVDAYKVYEQSVVLEKNKNLGEYYISKEYFESKLKNFEVKSGDFLVSCSGVNYGEIYELEGKIEKGVINQALLRVRINEKIIDRNYFLYYFRAYIAKVITGGSGDSTIPNFPPMDFVKNVEVELPDLVIQRKIGRILKRIDKKYELNNQINNNLEELAYMIFLKKFTQKIPNGAIGEIIKENEKSKIKASDEKFKDLKNKGIKIALYDAPTLFQTGTNSMCDGVIGIIADRNTRIERIIKRDNISKQAAIARIDAQPDDNFYYERCQYIIENNVSHETLKTQVIELWQKLIK